MRCPRDDSHEGIKVVKCEAESPHYAEATCAEPECGRWIKWLSKKQWVDLHDEGISGDKAEVYGVDLSAAYDKAIREIVEQEMEHHEIEYHNKS